MQTLSVTQRLADIALARRCILDADHGSHPHGVAPWITQSWQRCLQRGLHPEQAVVFDTVALAHMRRTEEANQALVQVARPTLEHLGRAVRHTGYFALLTNADGVVVDVSGNIDRDDPRAHRLTRVGTDLSERAVGTTAIGSALSDQHPVWLHRGEHFFRDTGHYSCAGAPVMGADGRCIGMLDLTGVEVPERPELLHLVCQAARRIQNALLLQRPHRLLLRLGWPGDALGSEADALVALDGEGWVAGFNAAARQMISALAAPAPGTLHASDLFGLPYQLLFDAACHPGRALEIPLWSGLYLQALAQHPGPQPEVCSAGTAPAHVAPPLKALEASLIRRAVEQARGNVAAAAQALGISRATVYRKLRQRGGH